MKENRPIRILLIEDNPADARLVREALRLAADDAVEVHWADRLSKGIERLDQESFDAALLDLSLPDSRGIETFTRLHAHSPRLPIVVLSGLDDEGTALSAVREGAQDYMVKGTFKVDALVRVLRFAIERQRSFDVRLGRSGQRSQGKIVCVMGAKGGSGTTSVCLNVAAALARKAKSVVAIEMNSYRSGFSVLLRFSPKRDLAGLMALEAGKINGDELSRNLVPTDYGASLLFASQNPEELSVPDGERAVAVLRAAATLASFVIVDLPGTPSSMHQLCAQICDCFALVVERDPIGVAAGKCAMPLLQSWGLDKDRAGVVLVTKNPWAACIPPADVRTDLGCPVIAVIPPASEALTASYRVGVPLVIHDAENLAAESLVKLAERLAEPVLVEVGE